MMVTLRDASCLVVGRGRELGSEDGQVEGSLQLAGDGFNAEHSRTAISSMTTIPITPSREAR